MLKPALQLRLGQQLTMTPQLQQAIRLLQLPVLELQAQIREALESNVMLESEEDGSTGEAADATLEQPFEGGPTPEPRETSERQEAQPEPEADPVDDPDWNDSPVSGPSESPWSGEDHSQDFSDSDGETLQEHLSWQLEMSRLAPR